MKLKSGSYLLLCSSPHDCKNRCPVFALKQDIINYKRMQVCFLLITFAQSFTFRKKKKRISQFMYEMKVLTSPSGTAAESLLRRILNLSEYSSYSSWTVGWAVEQSSAKMWLIFLIKQVRGSKTIAQKNK